MRNRINNIYLEGDNTQYQSKTTTHADRQTDIEIYPTQAIPVIYFIQFYAFYPGNKGTIAETQ